MHILVLTHGDPEHLKDLVAWLKSRVYKNNPRKWNIKPREMKLLDLTIPEEIEEQVIADLNLLQRNRLFNKIEGMNGPILNLIKKKFKVEEVNLDIPATHPKDAKLLGNTGWCYVCVLGKVMDERNVRGEEAL